MSEKAPDDKINQEIPEPTEGKAIAYGMSAVADYLIAFIKDVMNLQKGVDKRATIAEIRDKKSLSGANAWMLMCSIVIASIGLSQNSQAVIIGAMLISPLMSPILGIGLSVGINDMDTLRKSLANFGLAIAIAIITSTLYFYIVNFGEITGEIVSRTRPTLLDIFVAIFGGVAGIISIARKDLSTTLPGVAIATALMPPLCVTGYGIANGNADIAAKSFYLFFLNSFFVALATYLIIRLLQFPFKKYVKKAERNRNTAVILLFATLIIVPSLFIFKNVIKDQTQKNIISQFIKTCIAENQVYLDSYQFIPKEQNANPTLYLKCYGDVINTNDLDQYKSCLAGLGLSDVNIKIISSSEVNLDQVRLIERDIEDITAKLSAVNEEKKQQEAIVKLYITTLIDTSTFLQLDKELKALFPELKEFGLSKMQYTDGTTYQKGFPSAVVRWEGLEPADIDDSESKMMAFIKERLALDTLQILRK